MGEDQANLSQANHMDPPSSGDGFVASSRRREIHPEMNAVSSQTLFLF